MHINKMEIARLKPRKLARLETTATNCSTASYCIVRSDKLRRSTSQKIQCELRSKSTMPQPAKLKAQINCRNLAAATILDDESNQVANSNFNSNINLSNKQRTSQIFGANSRPACGRLQAISSFLPSKRQRRSLAAPTTSHSELELEIATANAITQSRPNDFSSSSPRKSLLTREIPNNPTTKLSLQNFGKLRQCNRLLFSLMLLIPILLNLIDWQEQNASMLNQRASTVMNSQSSSWTIQIVLGTILGALARGGTQNKLLLAHAQNYKPDWPANLLQQEIFLLNLEDGYFGCQVNSSQDFLQLFELSRLCDGQSQCFLGSDELVEQLKCKQRQQCTTQTDSRGQKEKVECLNGVCLDGLCYCNDGFGGKSCDIPDENECKYRPCDVFAHCTNTMGSYYCSCFPGEYCESLQSSRCPTCWLGAKGLLFARHEDAASEAKLRRS